MLDTGVLHGQNETPQVFGEGPIAIFAHIVA